MAQVRLDRKLLDKIATKLGKDRYAINVKVSKKASKYGISSEAALILLAKELNIGTAHYQRKLDPTIQVEVRETLPILFTKEKEKSVQSVSSTGSQNKGRGKDRGVLKHAIEYLLNDQELLERCGDLLRAQRNFDRAISQATLVLEARIRAKSQPPRRLVGENLVNYAFNENLSRTVLKVSDDPQDQRGFTQILRGMVPAFRNKTHHHVTDSFTREDALRVCGFIDVLLRVVDNSKK